MAYAAASGILQFVSSASLNPSWDSFASTKPQSRRPTRSHLACVLVLRIHYDSLEEREHQSGIVSADALRKRRLGA